MTSPLSPEAVAQMVADLPSRWKDAAPNPNYRGEELLPIVYADPGSNGWYYRERKPDSVTAYVRVDLITSLAAENATLRAENEELDFLRHEGGPDSVAAMEIELATLRASEAAALERVKVLTEALEEILSNDSYESRETFDGSNKHVVITKFGEFGQIAHAALTPTADKEPKT